MSTIPSSAMPHPHGDPEGSAGQAAPANDEGTVAGVVATAKDALAGAKDAASGAYGSAKDAASGAYSSARDVARDAYGTARDKVSEVELPKPSVTNLLIGAAIVGGIAAAAFTPFFLRKAEAPKRRAPARKPAARKTPVRRAKKTDAE